MKIKQVLAASLMVAVCFLNANAQKKIYIDCYGANGGAGWNNVNFAADGVSSLLTNSDSNVSAITIAVSNRMTAGTFSVASGSFTGDALEFLPSGSNGAFGSVISWSGNPPCPQADLVFSGLETNIAYTFTYFASRNNDSTGWVREAAYILNGASVVTNLLDAADNFSQVAISDPVYPDASGQIILTLKPGPNNTVTGNYYFYLNALKIEYMPAPVIRDPEIIYIDPTSSAGYIGAGWNGINFLTADATLALITTNDLSSGISATVITRLAGTNANGSPAPTSEAAEFAPAGPDSVYGCEVIFNGNLAANGLMRFDGLNTNVAYTFTMYASRMGVSDIRDAEYKLVGAQTNSAVLDAANNDSDVVIISNVYADVTGQIDFSMVSGPANNNSYRFFYLSAMKIEYIPPVIELKSEIYVDVAGANSGANWNQILANELNSSASLITYAGGFSGYSINVTDPLNSGINSGATATRTGDAAEFQPMGNENAYGANGTFSQGLLTLSNLNPANIYNFTFFASRMSATDNREALYTVTGQNSLSAALDSVNNTSNVCVVAGIQPTAAGEIQITAEKGPNNNNGSGYFYLAVFKISVYEEPGSVPPPIPAGSKRLLFFGDQFSKDRDVPGLVRDLALFAGYDMPFVVADLALDADLADHVSEVASHPENNVDSVLLPDGDAWDHVIIQGSGTEATRIGDPLSFRTNAVALYQLVKSNASGKGASAEAILFQTWAAAPEHGYYPGSFADPAAMQLDIRTNYNAAADMINTGEGAGSARVAGAGDAFETGDFYYALYEPDYFAESEFGDRLAAMVLYKAIYHQDATNLSYAAAVSAGWTTMNEYDWNNLVRWADGVSTSVDTGLGQSEVIYIDPFGGEAPTIWNNVPFNATTVMELRNTRAELTGIMLSVTNRMQAGGTFGSAAPVGDAAEFTPAGNTGVYGSDSDPDCDALFTGMKPGRGYTFTFYSSRMDVTDNREASFTLTGSTQVNGALDAAANSSEVLVLSLNPAADGSILLYIAKGPNNDNTDGFYYLSAMKLESSGYGTILILR